MTNPDQSNNLATTHDPTAQQKPFARVSMEPLFERLLKRTFPDSKTAIEHCRKLCAEFGFTVKQEASANRNIYVYCSREGLPDSQRNPKPSPQRKRPSKRCDCRWRVVLSENEHEQWEFRKSMNPTASEHNHEMMSPDEMVKAWPTEVNDLIIHLARQRLQTHEIREAVKSQFPDITWNERRFYNRLTEERKRIKQRGVLDRSQRLLVMSARLCAVVASNEDWTAAVEIEMAKMLENYSQLSRLSSDAIASLSDLHPDMIHMDGTRQQHHQQQHHHSGSDNDSDRPSPDSTSDMALDEPSPTKKRKSTSSTTSTREVPKGAQVVHIPNYTLYVRHQPMRSSSEPSTHASVSNTAVAAAAAAAARRTFIASPPDLLSPQHQIGNAAAAAAFGQSSLPLASPTSSSSSSTSSLSFQRGHSQQQQQYPRRFDQQQQQRVSSPMQHPSISPHDAPPSFVAYHQSHQHQQQQPQQQHEQQHQTQQHHAAAAAAAAAVTPAQNNYNVAQTVAYPMASFAPFSAPSTEMPFGFDGGMAGSFTPAAARATPMPGSLERPEPTHPHDVTTYRQQQPQQTSSFGYYPVKEEPMDQRMLLRDQRMQRNMSQQGYMPMMRGDEDQQQHHPSSAHHHHHHHQPPPQPPQQQQHQQSEWA
ncbi:hypothetical protein RO3G_03251 [Lichtheimia corymbifera JMRC:FSU:9682]|uniref:FAR1 domain-containing protein n=1 Tax=Lichtheimia corymbifera JMRC:FSU:9682 TaxID=1263082 RepID=A0A068RX37_9FUNG|nr:hypothetical protein RO3G_03251 [Lichtheimia corymbifera JMRC:FSU:9682]